LSSPVTAGVLVGLFVGKTVGVAGAAALAVRLRVAKLPRGVSLTHLLGVAMAAGIGFTVAIFVTGISLGNPELEDQAKIGIFGASIVAAVGSSVMLSVAHRRASPAELALEAQEEAELFETVPASSVLPSIELAVTDD
jgi:NhaA family Na+:H+ antiporter